MPNARQFFEETFRPAKLLIEVYRLLDNDGIQTEHDWIKQLRPLVGAGADEELMLLMEWSVPRPRHGSRVCAEVLVAPGRFEEPASPVDCLCLHGDGILSPGVAG